jgi:aspartate ammonia-lyase
MGITANEGRCNRYMEESVSLATVLAPYLGYAAAAEVAKESQKTGRSVREIIEAREFLSPEELAKILDPYPLTSPGIPGKSER